MDDVAIRVENLSKKYQIGEKVPYRALRDEITKLFTAPFRKFKNKSTPKAENRYIWALKNVSFEVKRGEVVGIIGRNGAGKTTLLKVLSRITEPTEGYADVHGRAGTLLEVGTGFHPELTGRENTYLNGAILGMKKKEIDKTFDEIISFAEIERFIDTPVKRYSSGMYLRLAFAVAAHLEPEILLMDEVLAVGDASFQKKCLGKMGDVAKEGRTVLFVSHNMGAVAKLCHRSILLNDGHIVRIGATSEVIMHYMGSISNSEAELVFPYTSHKKIQIRRLKLLDDKMNPGTELDRNHSFQVFIEYEVRQRTAGAHLAVMLDKPDGTPICRSADIDLAPGGMIDRIPGHYRATVEFPGNLLNAGLYQIRVGIGKYGGELYDHSDGFILRLLDSGSFASLGADGHQRPGVLAIPLTWKTEKIT